MPRRCWCSLRWIIWENKFFKRRGSYFLLAQKVTKDALGVAFDERYAGGSAHRRLTPKPPFYGGRPPGELIMTSRRP